MSVQDLSEIALAARLPVRRGLHVEANVRELGREGGRDEQRILVRVGEELLRQSIFVVSAVDRERRDARGEPGDAVLAVARVIDWRRPAGRGEESKLVQGHPADGRKEHFAEGTTGDRVTGLAPRSTRRPE